MLRHPNFRFERFVEYLTRGVWPFLTALVVGLAVLLPGVLAFLVWARYERTWPFGPKEIREEYLTEQDAEASPSS